MNDSRCKQEPESFNSLRPACNQYCMLGPSSPSQKVHLDAVRVLCACVSSHPACCGTAPRHQPPAAHGWSPAAHQPTSSSHNTASQVFSITGVTGDSNHPYGLQRLLSCHDMSCCGVQQRVWGHRVCVPRHALKALGCQLEGMLADPFWLAGCWDY